MGRAPSDEDARRAAAALHLLLREPNELREQRRKSSQLADWETDLHILIGNLEHPPIALPEWEDAPAEPEPDPDAVQPGDVYDLALGDGRLFYAQVATRCQQAWLMRVLPGTFGHRPSAEELLALVGRRARFVHVVALIDEFSAWRAFRPLRPTASATSAA